MNNYPKVLIIGQPFHKFGGGGITISNLFYEWPKENIGVALDTFKEEQHDYTLCDNIYRLGKNEHKVCFPFNFMFKLKTSGKINVKEKKDTVKFKKLRKKKLITILEKVFYNFGFSLIAFRYRFSKEFKEYIEEFKPEIIYTQLAKIELILFAKVIIKETKIPLVIHIMDDWPKSMAKGPFKIFAQKYIDKKFRELLELSHVNLSISEGMSIEYKKRYGKDFYHFHNPIELEKWKTKELTFENASNKKRILYTGRISRSQNKCLKRICQVLEELQNEHFDIEFEIYSSDSDTSYAKDLLKYDGVTIKPPVPHHMMPEILVQYDVLLIPLEFTKWGISFVKYSMPTKASEYMISGVPVLVFASKETEIVRHAKKHEWAAVVDNDNHLLLKKELLKIIFDNELRKTLPQKAVKFARENYNAEIIRNKFYEVLRNE